MIRTHKKTKYREIFLLLSYSLVLVPMVANQVICFGHHRYMQIRHEIHLSHDAASDHNHNHDHHHDHDHDESSQSSQPTIDPPPANLCCVDIPFTNNCPQCLTAVKTVPNQAINTLDIASFVSDIPTRDLFTNAIQHPPPDVSRLMTFILLI